jgi:hypothetical protein
MSLRLVPVYLLIAGLLMTQQGLFASDCICVKYAMYPYAGGNWLHYAIKTKDACVNDYSLPQIQQYTPISENCISATDCGDCTTLGTPADVATVASSHFYTGARPRYTDINEESEIRDFLKNNTQLMGADLDLAKGQLDQMVFATPDGTSPPIVQLSRKTSPTTSQNFYAVLWKMRYRDATDGWAYVGIEISDRPATVTWTSTSIFRAFVTARIAPDEDLMQPIIVRGLLEVQANGTLYLVRLFNAAENKRSDAFPVRTARGSITTFSRGTQGLSGLDGDFPVLNPGTDQICCPNSVQSSSGNQYRTVWRGSRRRFR